MNLLDLPDELLASILNEINTVEELLPLEALCKIIRNVICSEEVWKSRIKKDYSLLSYVSNKSPVFRRRNFRQLYRALRNPEVFVWGSFDDGRLGIPDEKLSRSRRFNNEVYTPYLLSSMSNLGVSSIVCGGYMMLALTHNHEVYYWGTFDSGVYYMPYSHHQETPTLLEIFPKQSRIHQITAGRSHALALSETGEVFHFNNSNHSAPKVFWNGIDSTITQIACGFRHNLALTENHEVLWWSYRLRSRPTKYSKLVLPSDISSSEKIIKIAGGDQFTLGLTDSGKVFWWIHIHDTDEDFETMSQPPSTISLEFKSELVGSLLLEAAELHICHITAQFINFGLYDYAGKLIMGRCNINNRHGQETVNWEILNHPVSEENGLPIQVSFGDWHTGLLLDNGHLYTWGEHGLGQGDTEIIESPNRVTYFNENYFVFYVACAGWHTAALAVNLKPDSSEPLPTHELDLPLDSTSTHQVRLDLISGFQGEDDDYSDYED